MTVGTLGRFMEIYEQVDLLSTLFISSCFLCSPLGLGFSPFSLTCSPGLFMAKRNYGMRYHGSLKYWRTHTQPMYYEKDRGSMHEIE